jgi:hypothetical protein
VRHHLIAASLALVGVAGCQRERGWPGGGLEATEQQRTLSGNQIGVTAIDDAVAAIERDGDDCGPGTRDDLQRVDAAEVTAAVIHVCVGGRLLPGRRLVMAAPRAGAPITVYGVYETEPDLAVAARHVDDYLRVFEHLQGPPHLAIGGLTRDGQLARRSEVRREWAYRDLRVKVWAIDRGADGFDIGYRYLATRTHPTGADTP